MRSTIVAILVGLALVAGLAIVARLNWLDHGATSDAWWWSGFGVAAYAALTTGFVVRRIGQPRLRRPLLLYPLIIPIAALTSDSGPGALRALPSLGDTGDDSSRRDDSSRDDDSSRRDDNDDDDRDGSSDDPFTSPMGRGVAIAWTIFLLVVYAAGIALIVTRFHP